MIQEAVASAAVDTRRRSELFLKGVVSAVDESTDPPLYTISGRRMPMVQAGVVVGDTVVWVNQADPFGIGKFAGA